MHRAAIVSGTLTLGTALVFGAAALAAAMFPGGTTVPGSWSGGLWDRPMPAPMLRVVEPPIMVDDLKGGGGFVQDSGGLEVAPRP